jgi:AcrR family transcriptional regulator
VSTNADRRTSGDVTKRAAKRDEPRKTRVRSERSRLYRGLVIEAAERLFARKGADETRMDEVAAEAGMSLGTLYSVFKGKADIVSAIHDLRLSALLDASGLAARGERDTVGLLVAGVRGYVRFFLENPDYLRMHLREGYTWAGEQAAATRLQAKAWGDGINVLTTLLERGAREGLIHPGNPAVQARMLIATQQVQLAAWVESGMTGNEQTVLDEVELHLRRAFCK